MEKTKIHLAVGLAFSVLFLILAVALSNWRCGTVLNTCLVWPNKESYQIVGALLVCAIAVNIIAFAIVITGCITSRSWTTPAAVVLTWLGGILALAAVAYYFSKLDSIYCPLLAVIGMTFALAMAITTSITIVHVRLA
ncbi:unnamed protein product [Schistocephalus solidus]|uniref:Uncharacterized protein n=1 Tax=Schistocephalus solidus TaxID=70667 RepID=A0A183TMV7_SCHSO|nr:unnamed protein product [Schistocephalus solidus]